LNASSEAGPTVLHYTGYVDDRSGIHSTIAALEGAGRLANVLGVHPAYRATRDLGLKVLSLPAVPEEKISCAAGWAARRTAMAVKAWLEGDRKRFYHGHSRAGLLIGLWLAQWGCRRVVISVHCYARQRWFYRWAARKLQGRLFWLSPAMRHYYGAPGEGWSQCLPECVPHPGVSSSPMISGSVLRLGGAGQRVRWKRWDLIVRALAELPAESRRLVEFQHIGATGTQAGAVAYEQELRALTNQSGLDAQVRWLPPEPDTRGLLARVDAVVVASHREPMSLVMLEALAAGVPVLAADSGGAADIIRPGVNGWLFRDGDAADLARVIALVAKKHADLRLNRPTFLSAELTAVSVASRWRDVYLSLGADGVPSQR
jgi:glycosyltransferase involved in cell wall biosynthesis